MLLFLACAEPVPTSGSLTVLSYNVHGLPSAITGDDTEARLATIGPLLEDYDLVGVQEDWMEDTHALLETTHPTQDWFDDDLSDRAYGSGLFTLARGASVEAYEEHFDACYGLIDHASDCGASKGFQIHRVELVEGVTLDFLNTHLEAGGSDDDTAARAVGVDQIDAAIQDFSAGQPMLFVGDLNLKWSDPEDTDLMDQIWASGPFEDACEPDCDVDEIDHILVRETDALSLTVTYHQVESWLDDDGVDLSDHDPVVVHIDWSTE